MPASLPAMKGMWGKGNKALDFFAGTSSRIERIKSRRNNPIELTAD